MAGDIHDPQTLNRYAYVRNNPTNLTDPTGSHEGCGNPDYYYGYYCVGANDGHRPGMNCSVDGAITPCRMAFSLMGSGAAAWCPDNDCSSVIQLTNNGFTLRVPAGHLILNAVQYEDGSVVYSWSFWSRRFIQVASGGFLGPNDSYLTGEIRQLATLSQAYDKAIFDSKAVAATEGLGLAGLAGSLTGLLSWEAKVLLYRAVGQAEFDELMETGTFQQGPNSLEGKWFAESPEAATDWGERLNGPGNYRIIEVEVPASVADTFFRNPMLDSIGPARYANPSVLNSAGPIIRPWP
jgi:hypothetical protein